MELVAGFSNETIFHMLGGRFRSTFRPLNDAIIDGRIRGVVGIVGCSNPKMVADQSHVRLTEELIKRNVLVLQTGCAAIACAKAGLLTPEAALAKAGASLREVCEAVGIPPVLHMGSCVDNSRILLAATNLLAEGGLGEDLSDLPVAGAAPEWMSEKAVAIGHYFVASGLYVVLGHPLYVDSGQRRRLCGWVPRHGLFLTGHLFVAGRAGRPALGDAEDSGRVSSSAAGGAERSSLAALSGRYAGCGRGHAVCV
jgi:carbon-monoxide dehydrogenase catalytic subunit